MQCDIWSKTWNIIATKTFIVKIIDEILGQIDSGSVVVLGNPMISAAFSTGQPPPAVE